ncbi:serine protease [Bacillus sp. AFS076308]|uniref:S8 family peptidase n=1 Tax=unclassified Bacillus (in: firmicutes) TaxID=185979 RepID=UPI000BF7E351|nr:MULTISPECIES: S8 family peptidase [unclassified Bacillus (in: firmicutes)]PFO09411.1 serine protease [Bacillus sp. AFS076308]PGV50389.1 serine protease [Bacillus sp. AFS037270]
MERKMHLIPYQFIAHVEEVTEVPKGVEMIQAPKVWEKTKGSGMTIAILDTGCDLTHPDLKDRIIGGRNFTNDDNGNKDVYRDYNGHGTHVAGTMAATQNQRGVVGVAPEANLLIVKVLDKNGSGQYDWIINGIYYAIEQQADIISMSLGGPEDVSELHEAIQKAVEHNILVVCAAGNEGDGQDATNEFDYPGSYNEVISVGAVNLDRRISDFSNSNNEVDLVAPGETILSTYLNGKFATLSGTSMATPHVSGALALIKVLANQSFDRELTVPELYAQLIKRTVPLGHSPKLEGNGIVYLTAVDYLTEIFNSDVKAEVLNN